MSEKPDRELLLKTAWQRWFEADYSWEGLKRPSVGGSVFAPGEKEQLIKYWRSNLHTRKERTDKQLIEDGELIIHAGQKDYHIAHLPLYYEDGTPTIKITDKHNSYSILNKIIIDRLNKSQPSITNSPDYLVMAQFQGIVIENLNISEQTYLGKINADFRRAMFLGQTYFYRSFFSFGTSFSEARFLSSSQFSEATFHGSVNFQSAEFLGFATFDAALFEGPANFLFSCFYGGAEHEKNRTISAL